MLHQIICNSTLQFKTELEHFINQCYSHLEYLDSCVQEGKCTEEQKYIIDSLNDWMATKGYQMIADTLKKMSSNDEEKALEFIDFYEFMLRCSSGDIEKLIDYLFYIPKQFRKQFTNSFFRIKEGQAKASISKIIDIVLICDII